MIIFLLTLWAFTTLVTALIAVWFGKRMFERDRKAYIQTIMERDRMILDIGMTMSGIQIEKVNRLRAVRNDAPKDNVTEFKKDD